MKKAISILFLLAFVSCAHLPQHSVAPQIKNIYDSSVSVGDKDMNVSGSGTILVNKKGSPMEVLTAAHVIRGMEKKWIERKEKKLGEPLLAEFYVYLSYKDTPKKMVVKKIDEKRDLALLVGETKEMANGPYVKVSNNFPNIGDFVWVIGSPMGDTRTTTTGIVSNFEKSDGRGLIRISAPMFFGNSGGGVFNSDLELIGVAHAIQSIAGIIFVPGGNFAVDTWEIQAFLK